ncbi:MAG: hypothetical protein HFJ52_03755 [Clostridia bacterium]|nr:hypothetical protein [Clostridia bacterium]
MLLCQKNFGTINTKSPIEESIEELKRNEWDNDKVLEIFTRLRFNKYIDRFSLRSEEKEVNPLEEIEIIEDLNEKHIIELTNKIEKEKQIIYYLNVKENTDEEKIIKKDIYSISIIIENKVYYIANERTIKNNLQKIFENSEIKKISYKLKQDYILLKQMDISLKGFSYDIEIAGYIIDSIKNKYDIETLSIRYLNIELQRYLKTKAPKEEEQLTLFSMTEGSQDEEDESEKIKACLYIYAIKKLYEVTKKMIEDQGNLELFQRIEMPTAEVLAKMQYTGIGIDKEELIEYGRKIKAEIEEKTNKIYQLCDQEFNINSTKQLGKVLFEDLKLPVQKKKKSGYSTDVEVLEKLREEHPVIQELLDYRQLCKLNSTYVEGMLPYINKNTERIHSYFHQTVTATGRISSAEPNLQNIPTRFELGKNLRKVFKPRPRLYLYRRRLFAN